MVSVSQLDMLILAGGLGSRLREVISDRPKAMAPVAGKPFVEWLLLAFREQGIQRFLFCTGHFADAISGHFGDGRRWNVEISYSHETEPLGTGGALALASRKVGSDRFFAANGDSWSGANLPRLLELHDELPAHATVWLVPMPDTSRFGSVEVAPDGQIRAFREKSNRAGGGLVNAGVYLFERSVFDGISANVASSLETEILPALAGQGLYGAVGEGPLLDIGTPESYAAAEDFFAAAQSR
ncbi:MAG TPA: nucleotidyltransferase family protein [Thermoanaerobaculia bacterium]